MSVGEVRLDTFTMAKCNAKALPLYCIAFAAAKVHGSLVSFQRYLCVSRRW